tara:strand:+ start:379 stop:1239 length:861 start_codon:yes stop_codon:yes gene_type:complete
MKLKIGITGSNGWIGKYLKKKLKSVHSIVDLDPISRNLKSLPNEVPKSCRNLDWILHLGSNTSIIKSFQDPFSLYQNNIVSTLSMLKLADLLGSKFLLFSSYIYGDPIYVPIDEKHPVKPKNLYMDSKWVCENISRNISKNFNLPLITLRLFNIYGPGLKSGRLVSDLISNVKNMQDLIVNDPEPRRDYLFIDDLFNLIIKILYSDVMKSSVYNVGGGIPYSNLEIAKKILLISKSDLCLKVLNKRRKNDILNCVSNSDKVKKVFKWEPKYNIKDGLSILLNENSC